jgi:hypothetical protein
LELC